MSKLVITTVHMAWISVQCFHEINPAIMNMNRVIQKDKQITDKTARVIPLYLLLTFIGRGM